MRRGRIALAAAAVFSSGAVLAGCAAPADLDGEMVAAGAQQSVVPKSDKSLPVVVYSARDDNETIDQALSNGAQDYLVKSQADFDRVQACIEEHLGEVH